MPKSPTVPVLNIDLLKSQGSSQKLAYKAIKWLLSAGRYLIIFVELIVLIAFITRVFLDAQNETVKDEISKFSIFVESLKPAEREVKEVQAQINFIKEGQKNSFNFNETIQKIANQTPPGVSLILVNFDRDVDKIKLRISGVAQTNLDLSAFVYGLKSESIFSDIDIASLDLEQSTLNFSITGNIK